LPALLLSESYFASFVFVPSLFTFALNIFHARAFLIYLNSPHFLLSLFLSVKCLSRFTHLLSSGSFCWLASLSLTHFGSLVILVLPISTRDLRPTERQLNLLSVKSCPSNSEK
jgi:hypothetical protein